MRIAVAMSGGVDSSTAAALLAAEGHQVVGLTLKVWDGSRCCSVDDVVDARRVARHLGIPFYVLDAHAEFEAQVLRPFVDAYAHGLTPNPCVWCNRRLKFGWLVERVRALGCEALATGHYARTGAGTEPGRLRKAADRSKDQSYFVVPETPSGLERVRFPLGGLAKEEVRRIATQRGIPVATKPESQDVCFFPKRGLARFLQDRLGRPEAGEVVDAEGRVLGRHQGIHAYTVGQRKGLGIAARRPLYVVRREVATNRLVVGPREELMAGGLVGRDAAWLAETPPGPRIACSVKIRSTAPEVACEVEVNGRRVAVRFAEPQFGVAPGQAAVFYEHDLVLGAAWIEAPLSAA